VASKCTLNASIVVRHLKKNFFARTGLPTLYAYFLINSGVLANTLVALTRRRIGMVEHVEPKCAGKPS